MNDTNQKNDLLVDEKDVLVDDEKLENTQTDEQVEFDKDAEYQEFLEALEEVNNEFLSESQEDEQPVQEESDKVDVSNSEPEQGLEGGENESAQQQSDFVENAPVESAQQQSEDGEFCENGKQYKEYKVNKILSKVNCDLSNPELKIEDIKGRILDGLNYNFNSYAVLTAKLKKLNKALKSKDKKPVPICAVIGAVESPLSAKKSEIREAKWQKASQIEMQISTCQIKEDKKNALVKELSALRKLAGSKVLFKCAIDVSKLTEEEFDFALACAISAKVQCITLKNFEKANSPTLLKFVKKCSGVCLIELSGEITCLKPITYYGEIGVDYFRVVNAVALAEKIKIEVE